MDRDKFFRKFLNKLFQIFLLGFVLISATVLSSKVFALSDGRFLGEEIFLLRGDLESIKTDGMTRISVSNPEIADIANINADHVMMLAKRQGHTNVFIWDSSGKRSIVIKVFDENLDMILSRIEQLLSKVDIEGLTIEKNVQEAKVVISGELIEAKRNKLNDIIAPFSPNVLSLVRVKDEKDLVQIDVQIAELNTSATQTLGIDWSNGSALTFAETLPGKSIDKPWDVFRIGEFRRTTAIENVLNALITEGKGRVLSRPKLVVKSGQEANFNVGGQIPVVTRTLQDTNILENVVYRNYGINLQVTPTLTDDAKIDIDLRVDVSDIDSTTPVADQVSFTNRTAETKLYLDNRQTVVLAGLIKKNKGENVTRIPFLSNIPVVGAIFRNKTISPDTETELVISLTPTMLTDSRNLLTSKHKTTDQSEEFDDEEDGDDDESDAHSEDMESTLSEDESPLSMGDAPLSENSQPTSSLQDAASSQAEVPSGARGYSEEMMSYSRDIQRRVAEHLVYPDEARKNYWQGTVKLALHILDDGTLLEARIKESSGYEVLDSNALMAARDLSPFPVFPSATDRQELNLTIPLVFSIDTP